MQRLLKKPWIIITVTLAVTAVFSAFIPTLVMDNDVRAYFPHSHPSYIRSDNISDTFGSVIQMVVAVEADGPTILTADSVSVIDAVTREIEATTNVDKVQSLTNVDYIVGIDGGLSAEKLVPKGFDGSSAQIEELRRRIVDWSSMYKRLIVSEDFKAAQIVVSINRKVTPEQSSELLRAVNAICQRHSSAGLSFRQAGDPVLSDLAKTYMKHDLIALIPVVTVVVLLSLLFAFGSIEGMLLPLVTVVISTSWVLGIMAIFHLKFTVISSCLPVVLIAVGSAYGIHVLSHYYDELTAGAGPLTRERHTELVVESTKKVVKPVFLAGITTIAGFVSNLTSPIEPLKVFSIFSSLGVTIALILALTFIPAILIVKRKLPEPKAKAAIAKNETTERHTVADALFNAVMRRPGAIIGAFAVIIAAATWGFCKLNIESSIINYFAVGSQIRKDVSYIDQRFAGSNMLSIVVTGPDKGALTDPTALKAMDDLSTYLVARHPEIGKIASFSDFVRRMNKVMHAPQAATQETQAASPAESGGGEVSSFFADEGPAAPATPTAPAPAASAPEGAVDLQAKISAAEVLDLMQRAYARIGGGTVTADQLLEALERELNFDGAAYDEIPEDTGKYMVADREELKNLVSQYLMLYSGSISDFADDALQPKSARMQIAIRSHSTKVTKAIIEDAKAFAAKRLPSGYSLEAGGIAELESSLSDMIIASQISSIAVAAVAVFVILWLSFGSLFAGLIGSMPLLISILINFGIMGFAGINLDMITSLVSSIAIGIGIDYTIHFMNTYNLERLACDDLSEVTKRTFRISGKAIVVNAVSVGLGFLVLCLSNFVVLRYIGFLVAVVMLTSTMPAMTVLPICLNVFKPAFISRRAGERRAPAKA